MDRRTFIRGMLGATGIGLAGCSGDGGGTATETSPTGTPTDTPTPTEDSVLPSVSPTATPDPSLAVDGFVERDGTDLLVDGQPTAFSGGNAPQLSLIGEAGTPRGWLETWHEHVPAMNVLRVPFFGDGQSNRLQPSPGEYNERAFELLDEIVYRFGNWGVRLVPFLTNYWEWRGGMDQYVAWSDTADSREDFYADEQCRGWYRDFIEYVLERENTITGVQYKDDPTILAWELANEPRGMEVDNDVVLTWIEETASFIKDVDSNHLVSTGMEGFYAQQDNDDYQDGWQYDGSQGPGYLESHALDVIDLCSFHLYPDSWDTSADWGTDWIERHTRDALETVGKPCYLGEFGMPVDRTDDVDDSEQLASRTEVYAEWYDAMLGEGTNGAMVWDLRLPDEYPLGWNQYAIFPRDEASIQLLQGKSTAFGDSSETA